MNKKLFLALSSVLVSICIAAYFIYTREQRAIDATFDYAMQSRSKYDEIRATRQVNNTVGCNELLKVSNLESVLDSFSNISTPLHNLLGSQFNSKKTQQATNYLLNVLHNTQQELWVNIQKQQLTPNNTLDIAAFNYDFFHIGEQKGIDEISESSILAYTSTQKATYQILWDIWKHSNSVDEFCTCWKQPFEKAKIVMPTHNINLLYDIQCVKRMPLPPALIWHWRTIHQ